MILVYCPDGGTSGGGGGGYNADGDTARGDAGVDDTGRK